jgi:hypothetical protein
MTTHDPGDPTPTEPVPQPPAAEPASPPSPPPPDAPRSAAPPSAAPPPPGAVPPPASAGWSPSSAGAGPSTGAAPRSPGGLVFGIILVVVGGIVLVSRLADITFGSSSWPLWIIVPGLAMLVGSFAIPPRGGLGLAIPGAILAMVGAVLWVQETYDVYASWAYAWALVAPTAVGLGMLAYGLVRGDRGLVSDGLRTTLVGLALFAGFALFFEGVLGVSGHPIENLDSVLPYAAIGIGILLVLASLFAGPRERDRQV